MNGWYKQQRNLTERPWFKDALMVQLYAYLKEHAYVTDGRYDGIIIRKGSCPTTRSEMSEMTGMSVRTLDRVLRRLVSYGEIIVRGNNRFSVITICDYDSCDVSESLFGLADGTTDGIAGGIAAGTTDGIAYNNIEERINKKENLISPNSPYKNEREMESLALEIKKRYNKMFEGLLPPLIRLHLNVRNMVLECIRRFGMQSIDIVFDQVQHEKFSMGNNKTGFIASFQYIFEPQNFQKYLERAQLRKTKKTVTLTEEGFWPATAEKKSVGSIDAHEVKSEPQQTDKERFLSMIDIVTKNPTSYCKMALIKAYDSGELAQLGINWNPTKISQV